MDDADVEWTMNEERWKMGGWRLVDENGRGKVDNICQGKK